MTDPAKLDRTRMARDLIDTNLVMVLCTADENGQPWASPVYYSPDGYRQFYWMSSTEVSHSHNLAHRPQVSIVVFDSRQTPGDGRGVYLSGTAEQVSEDDLDHGIEIFNGRFPNPAEHGLRTFDRETFVAPSPYRLYRATVTQHSVLCPRQAGEACAEHGRAFDHRTDVTL